MIYTIEVPDHPYDYDPFKRLFDWLDSNSPDSTDFLSLCFTGSVNAREARAVCRSFGITKDDEFGLVWGTVLACYFNHPLRGRQIDLIPGRRS